MRDADGAEGKVGRRLTPALAVSALVAGLSLSASASPPACHREDAAMVAASHAVVRAEVLAATGTRSASSRALEARYRVVESLKGSLQRDARLAIAVSCLDEPVPPALQGYPMANRYCRGSLGLALTGVDGALAQPRAPAPPGGWLLFLERDPGAWREVSRVSYGGGCAVSEATLSARDREVLRRVQAPGETVRP